MRCYVKSLSVAAQLNKYRNPCVDDDDPGGVPVRLCEGSKLVSRFDALRSGHGSDRIGFDDRAFF